MTDFDGVKMSWPYGLCIPTNHPALCLISCPYILERQAAFSSKNVPYHFFNALWVGGYDCVRMTGE